MKQILKNMFGLTVAVPLGGAVMGMIGDTMTGSLKGIGNATQSMVGVGILGKASKMWK